MKKYQVIKEFYKLTEQKKYLVGDLIELEDEQSILLLAFGYVKDNKKEKK